MQAIQVAEVLIIDAAEKAAAATIGAATEAAIDAAEAAAETIDEGDGICENMAEEAPPTMLEIDGYAVEVV
ncbi:hypothetical protein BTUL_0403g00020 [Botrytis tulipae]|uniref:Uncharacterized protein n=1 Tax=Botrytis tulipae TaxID=87230 RepID=A0A4Z1E476_9HELO|nr:hypothetical protein BTUL_0403g00020 [Botrytis tulipae]